MAQRIGVQSYQGLADAVNKLNQIAGEYDQKAKDFQQIVNDMSNNEIWQGADNQAFCEQVARLIKNLNSLAEKIRDEAKNIDAEKQNYIDRQNQVKNSINSLNA